MNKIFKRAVIIACSLPFFYACSNDIDDVVSNISEANDIEVVNGGSMLKFKDQASLLKTLESLDKVEESNLGIKSLYTIYNEAMEVADEAYISEESYGMFKEKYKGSLLFPEYEDDYSAYLPISSKTLAKVLNAEGKVMLGDEVKDYKDLHTYQDLQKAGVAWIQSENQLKSDSYTSSYELSGNKKFKIRVKINNTPRREFTETLFGIFPGNTAGLLHFEITYRFKGFLGKWYNHNSNVTFTANLMFKSFDHLGSWLANRPLTIGPSHTYKSSSVDHWCPNYPLEYKGTVRVQYSGIDKTWSVSRNFD